MLADLKYALRQLRKSPGFAATAILTLAIGIGANSVVFSVVNTLVIRPLDLPHAEQLAFFERMPMQGPTQSYPDYRDLRDQASTFSGVAAYRMDAAGLDTGKEPSKIWFYEASGNYFDVAGVQPYLGRFFHTSDEHGHNSAPYVVLSYGYWRSHFGGGPQVVGKTIEIDKQPFSVIGVAPEKFRGTELFFSPALWIPLVDEEQIDGWNYIDERGDHTIYLVGRMKPGVSVLAAEADLNRIAKRLAAQYPQTDQGLQIHLARPGLVGDTLGRPVRAFLGGVMLLAALILLATCANLGSLFAARAADRSREMAIRLALGSSRERIFRQLLTEAIVVSLAGGALGVQAAAILLRWLSGWQVIPNSPIQVPVNPDWLTYTTALVLSILSGILFGITPIRQVFRMDAYELVKAGANAGRAWRRLTLRDVLLVVQIAVCAVLVTSSLVAVRGLVRSLHSDFGFSPQGAMLAAFDLKMAGYDDAKAEHFQRETLDAVKRIPGVYAAGYIDHTPLNVSSSDTFVYANGTTDFRPLNAAADALFYKVSPGYLDAAQTVLLAGRDFTWHDDAKSPKVAVVNEAFARKVFGAIDRAIGGYFLKGSGQRIQVVGVVQDGKYRTLTEGQQSAMFLPILQDTDTWTTLVVRSTRSDSQLAAAMQKTLATLDPGLPVSIETWPAAMDTALFAARAATVALGVMGMLGAMLAVTGIFGMASYSVSKRMRELGIRIALGARRVEVMQAALGRSVKLLCAGSVAGLLLGMAASKVLGAVVYQATPRDPLVIGGVVIAMVLLGTVAAWLPARRAAGVDPAILLRED
ncbi:MAG TPA: ABC transporter permease [Silvibacterium sp.]|nr:ABC transporter permease [Silvibacterium sp.]